LIVNFRVLFQNKFKKLVHPVGFTTKFIIFLAVR
jgi:hypothetical protein